MDGGTSAQRHPWFVRLQMGVVPMPLELLVERRQVTQNYGITGGILDCRFWTFPNGDPAGRIKVEHRMER